MSLEHFQHMRDIIELTYPSNVSKVSEITDDSISFYSSLTETWTQFHYCEKETCLLQKLSERDLFVYLMGSTYNGTTFHRLYYKCNFVIDDRFLELELLMEERGEVLLTPATCLYHIDSNYQKTTVSFSSLSRRQQTKIETLFRHFKQIVFSKEKYRLLHVSGLLRQKNT